jgi:HD-GYP domain-containing protein (c-di-GMP phosphodiesterase class II)
VRTRAPWGQMVVATVVVMVLPAVIVGALGALGVISSLWGGVLLAVALSLALTSAGSAYWRRHTTGDVLFSDLLLWGWLRRGRMERRLGRADDLLERAGTADAEGKADLLRDLGVALDAQDPYLDGHSRRVARYATMTASRLDLPAAQAERVRTAAVIHDIGKLRVPQEIVNKAGGLTDDEFELMKQHAGEGGVMVECLGDPALAAAVRSHHERWDGSGYPDGLAGERIPVEARIISVVDTFDAITSARSYRPATLHAKALSIIELEAGQQLDPDAARAFISCYTDRRGAALWAGIASVPRRVAERLSITPGEIAGVVAASLTAPLVVVAGAMAAAALPVTSDPPDDPPALSRQAASTPGPTATRGAQPTPSASAPQPAGTETPPAQDAGTPTNEGAGSQSEGAVAGAQATPSPGRQGRTASDPEEPLPAGLAAPAATPAPEAPAPAPEDPLSPWPPIFAPTPTPEPTPPPPTATPTPEPILPAPTPEPLPPLLAETLPVFPASTPTPPTHSKDDCKNAGWMDLGYSNQGQCIADAERPHRRP